MYRINKNKRTRFKCYFDGFAEAINMIKDNSSRDINNRDINKIYVSDSSKKIFKKLKNVNLFLKKLK